MKDARHDRLAELLVNYSVELRKGETCLINAVDVPLEMTEALVEAVCRAGGYPQVRLWNERLEKAMVRGLTKESAEIWADCDRYRMKKMDAFIGIRGPANTKETALLPEEQRSHAVNIYGKQVHFEERIPNTRWVVLRYPTMMMAAMANMPTTEFEDFYYRVTTGVDYQRMSAAFVPAKKFLDSADKVRITGEGTDLTFSIKGMGSVPCDGKMNIPDGEIYSAPVRDSVNGVITYNTSSTEEGFTFKDVRFEFADGKIVSASANDTDRLNHILDTDDGSRYIGEFALGCNPFITFPMDETLFDEKIMGSFHFTPGNAYDDCDNGNRSAVHWDLVAIQTPEYGGGEIRIDGELIRKDGVFVHEAFTGLNPENLS